MATKSSDTIQASRPSHDQVTERARKLWMERGRTGGRDLEYWLEAERQLRDEMKSTRGGKPPGHARAPDLEEAEKRLDGLIEGAPNPAQRTPAGEQL